MTRDQPVSNLPTPSFRPKGRIVLRHIGDESLLVPVTGEAAQGNRVYPLNATGAAMWEGVTNGESIGEVARSVSRAFDVTPEQAEQDCRTFIDELVREALLEPAS